MKQILLWICFGWFATSLAAQAPITLTIQNDMDIDLEPSVVLYRNIDPQDIRKLSRQVLYAHEQTVMNLRRTRYPSRVFIIFRVALMQAPVIASPAQRQVVVNSGFSPLQYPQGLSAPIVPPNAVTGAVVLYPHTYGAPYPGNPIMVVPGRNPAFYPPNSGNYNYSTPAATVGSTQTIVNLPAASPNYNPAVPKGSDIVSNPMLVTPDYSTSALPESESVVASDGTVISPETYCSALVPSSGEVMVNTSDGSPHPLMESGGQESIRRSGVCEFAVARWEYAEIDNAVAGCHLSASVSPYTIACSSNNDGIQPVITLNLGRGGASWQPTPLNYGGEPGAGVPTTP